MGKNPAAQSPARVVRERFPNVQAAIGLEALKYFDDWTTQARIHATQVSRALADLPGVQTPFVPEGCTHVYYQYCAYGPERIERDDLVVRCVRRGVDIEVLHVDVTPDMELFAGARAEADGARRASQAIQIPVYSSLTPEQSARVATVVRDVLSIRKSRGAMTLRPDHDSVSRHRRVRDPRRRDLFQQSERRCVQREAVLAVTFSSLVLWAEPSAISSGSTCSAIASIGWTATPSCAATATSLCVAFIRMKPR